MHCHVRFQGQDESRTDSCLCMYTKAKTVLHKRVRQIDTRQTPDLRVDAAKRLGANQQIARELLPHTNHELAVRSLWLLAALIQHAQNAHRNGALLDEVQAGVVVYVVNVLHGDLLLLVQLLLETALEKEENAERERGW